MTSQKLPVNGEFFFFAFVYVLIELMLVLHSKATVVC